MKSWLLHKPLFRQKNLSFHLPLIDFQFHFAAFKKVDIILTSCWIEIDLLLENYGVQC